MSQSLSSRFFAATQALQDSVVQADAQARAARAASFPLPMVGGPRADCANDLVTALRVAGETTDQTACCQLVLTAAVIGFREVTIRASAAALTVPRTSGLAVIRNDDGTLKTVTDNVTLAGITFQVGKYFGRSSKNAPATLADATAMLAMAVFAVGKKPTADNKPGFFGSSDVKGRAGALMSAVNATDTYLTGDRCIPYDDLAKIHDAFAADPSARLALFSMISSFLSSPLSPAEQAVASQASLLRSEGRGSYDRAIAAFTAFEEVLVQLPAYLTEINGLIRATQTLAAESAMIRDFGFIIYRDRYTTLRVSQFQRLATLGVLMIHKDRATSVLTLRFPMADPGLQGVKDLFEKLYKLFEARVTLINAQTDRIIKEAENEAAKTAA